MAHTALTSGALARICQGEDVSEPILQVLGHKAIAGSGQERFRLLLNDGEYSNSFSMLATQLNSLVHEDKIPQFSVIKVKKHICNQVAGQTKRVVIVLELEVLQRGEAVAKKIGNPVTIGSDGTVPPPNVQNQNANPNAGAGAVKRPSDAPMGGGPSKAATPSAPRSSASDMSFSKASLDQLKGFITHCRAKPEVLNNPELSFFHDYLVSVGANLPPRPEAEEEARSTKDASSKNIGSSSSSSPGPSAPVTKIGNRTAVTLTNITKVCLVAWIWFLDGNMRTVSQLAKYSQLIGPSQRAKNMLAPRQKGSLYKPGKCRRRLLILRRQVNLAKLTPTQVGSKTVTVTLEGQANIKMLVGPAGMELLKSPDGRQQLKIDYNLTEDTEDLTEDTEDLTEDLTEDTEEEEEEEED